VHSQSKNKGTVAVLLLEMPPKPKSALVIRCASSTENPVKSHGITGYMTQLKPVEPCKLTVAFQCHITAFVPCNSAITPYNRRLSGPVATGGLSL
jgi:hypothetical protein